MSTAFKVTLEMISGLNYKTTIKHSEFLGFRIAIDLHR